MLSVTSSKYKYIFSASRLFYRLNMNPQTQITLHSFYNLYLCKFLWQMDTYCGEEGMATDIWFMLGQKKKYYCDQESSLAFPGLSFCLKLLKGCFVNWRVLTSEWIKLEIDQSLIHIVEYFKSQYKMLVIAVRGKKRCLHSFQSKAWSHGNNLQLYETTAIMWMSFNIATTAATPMKKVYWMIISTTGRRGV